jgi:hypothetical protein
MLAVLTGLFVLVGCGSGPTSEVKGDNTGEKPATQTTAAATTPAETETTPAETETTPAETETSEPAEPAEEGITATFKVTSTGKASVTWGTGSGMSQDEIKPGKWSKKVKLDDFDVATLTVTSADFMKSQTVTCEVLINDVAKSKNKSKGKMAIASCTTNTTE